MFSLLSLFSVGFNPAEALGPTPLGGATEGLAGPAVESTREGGKRRARARRK